MSNDKLTPTEMAEDQGQGDLIASMKKVICYLGEAIVEDKRQIKFLELRVRRQKEVIAAISSRDTDNHPPLSK